MNFIVYKSYHNKVFKMKEELRDFIKAFIIPFKEDNPIKLK